MTDRLEPMELDVGQQMEITQRLLAACAGRASDELVEVPAGDLAALLHGLAALSDRQPLAAGLLPSADSVWPAIAALLQEHPDGLRICQIHRATKLTKQQIFHRLKRHGCSKVPGSYRWQLPPRRELQTSAERGAPSGE